MAAKALDEASLRALALAYLGRYATTTARLTDYLQRKLREREWSGAAAPDIPALVAECAARGYVDDAHFATARAASLARRGLGPARIRAALRQAGIDGETTVAVSGMGRDDALAAAIGYARRRRLGSWAEPGARRAEPARAMAAMLRAGHAPDIAREALRAGLAGVAADVNHDRG